MADRAPIVPSELLQLTVAPGVLITDPPLVTESVSDVIALPEQLQFGKYLGLAVLALVAWLLYRTGAKANPNAA